MTSQLDPVHLTLLELGQDPRVSVSIDGDRVLIRIADLDSASGLVGRVRLSVDLVVTLNHANRTFTVGTRTGESTAIGSLTTSGSYSWSSGGRILRQSGTMAGVGRDGAYRASYDTGPWIAEIERRLSSLGWQRGSSAPSMAAIAGVIVGGILVIFALVIAILILAVGGELSGGVRAGFVVGGLIGFGAGATLIGVGVHGLVSRRPSQAKPSESA